MADPNWNRGFYYDEGRLPPHMGMKLARQIATITYRSGPEWEQRFGRHRRLATPRQDSKASAGRASDRTPEDQEQDPALCPDFLIETYLDHQGESFCLKYDANSLIYISKAMDLFDMSDFALADLARRRRAAAVASAADGSTAGNADQSARETSCLADEESGQGDEPRMPRRQHIHTLSSPSAHAYLPALARGLKRLSNTPTLILGAQVSSVRTRNTTRADNVGHFRATFSFPWSSSASSPSACA